MTAMAWVGTVLLQRKVRRGMERLQRVYEYVLICAVMACDGPEGYYDGYVKALQILAAKAQPRAPRREARGACGD